MLKIAIYGKGGSGKSTTCANMSAALSRLGYKVMQIGCDPKSDSTHTLTGGKPIPTVLNLLKENPETRLSDMVFKGFNGVYCVETGGPTPGQGCAGRGIITAFEKLEEHLAFEKLKPDVVFYDVLGDVVCGGFAMPIRQGYAQKVYVVTSGEAMSLLAAENIHTAVKQFKSRQYARFSGLILNEKGIRDEEALVRAKADLLKTIVVQRIPRDPVVQEAEKQGKTVVELFPDHPLAGVYRQLAEQIMESQPHGI